MLLEPKIISEVTDIAKKLSEDSMYFSYKQIDSLLREQGHIKDLFNSREVEYGGDNFYTCISYSFIRDSTEQEIEEEIIKVEKAKVDYAKKMRRHKEKELFRLAKEFNYTLQENIE